MPSKARRQGRKANRPPVGGSQERKESENATVSEAALGPGPEPIGVKRRSEEEICDVLVARIVDSMGTLMRYDKEGGATDTVYQKMRDAIVENCHELVARVNGQKDMIRGLEEEVARRDVEADERLAERMAEEAAKVSKAYDGNTRGDESGTRGMGDI